MIEPFTDIEKARKNRELIAEMRKREALGENVEPPHRAKKKTAPEPQNLEEPEPNVTFEEFYDFLKKVTRPVKPKTPKELKGRPSAVFGFALGLLCDDEVKAFTRAFNDRQTKYGKEADFDAYMETLIERNDLKNIAEMLRYWIKYLSTLQNCQHTRGGIMVLQELCNLCDRIEAMRPPDQ